MKPKNKCKKKRSIKGIKVNECGLKGNNWNIYFNEDLTQYNQLLFKKPRELKKKNYKSAYCYTYKGMKRTHL